jgi:hypothetical protein
MFRPRAGDRLQLISRPCGASGFGFRSALPVARLLHLLHGLPNRGPEAGRLTTTRFHLTISGGLSVDSARPATVGIVGISALFRLSL